MNMLVNKAVRKMKPYTPGEQSLDPDIVKLNTNENPYPPSPRAVRAFRAFDSRRLRLYPDPMSLEVRRRIASMHGFEIDMVFAGNGSDEVLALCTRAFVEDSGTIGWFDPSYSLYPVLADIRNVSVKPVELDEEFGWRMPAKYGCSLFFLTNPNAPTGIMYKKADVRRFCRNLNGVVVIDEAYVDFSSGNCADLVKLGNVVVARTLSKAYSLAGLRFGYALGAPDVIGALFKLKDSYNNDMIAQRVALAALEDVAHMRKNVRRIVAIRERLSGALRQRGWLVYPSETNFLWARPSGISAGDLYARLRERKILIRYFPGARTGDYVRITIGADNQVCALLAALDDIAGQRLRR